MSEVRFVCNSCDGDNSCPLGEKGTERMLTKLRQMLLAERMRECKLGISALS